MAKVVEPPDLHAFTFDAEYEARRALTDLAHAIAESMRPTLPLDIDLWSADEIAAYVKMTPRYVAEHLVMHPSFPRPIYFPTGIKSKGGRRRYKASEVIEWAESWQEKKRR